MSTDRKKILGEDPKIQYAMTLVMNLDNKKILMNLKCLFYKNMRINMYFVCVGCILEVVVSVFSNCISSKNNFFEDQNHRAPVISFLKIEAPIQKIPYRPRFFLLPVTLLFIRNRNSHSMDYYRLKKKSPEILLLRMKMVIYMASITA